MKRSVPRTSLSLFIALLASLAIAGSAAGARLNDEGTGSFEATGSGTVVLRGNVLVFGRMSGTLVVRDSAGDALVRVHGRRVRLTRRVVLQNGVPVMVNGSVKRVGTATVKVRRGFYVEGSDVRVEVRTREAEVSLSAVGRGRIARLAGEGVYRLNEGPEQQWAAAVMQLRLAPPPPEPALKPQARARA